MGEVPLPLVGHQTTRGATVVIQYLAQSLLPVVVVAVVALTQLLGLEVQVVEQPGMCQTLAQETPR